MVSSPSPPPPFPTVASEPKQQQQRGGTKTAPEKANKKYAHVPTPLHHVPGGASKQKTPRGAKGADDAAAYVAAVSCSDCRFKQRPALAPASPGAVIRSLFVSLTRRSTPRSSPSPTSSASVAAAAAGDAADGEQWRLAAADLSRRLAAATRTRDEALEETTRLKHSLAELELKLARLEARVLPPQPTVAAVFPVDAFLRAVSTARAAVRNLARALSTHLRSSSSPAPNLESFLNRAFHADFELDTDADVHTPDPAGRCEANLAAYHAVAVLTWEEVLIHGTKHYSEGLSRFCDAKMSEVVSSLGWARARAWPEPLLQAFFLAAKGVWGVRLLARSVHPPLPVVRAERGARFDARFMEDAAAGRAGRLEPASVKMMVAPGFHVYLAGAGVVKCRVVCFYSSSNGSNGRTGGHRDGGSSTNGSVGLGSSCSDMNGSATDVADSCKSSRG
ncbi:hypothetical protein HU200_025223 [Digitaria exilis]|uniref:GIL1/IRKI C-terminal domain-containing protein n=1 Tax=Digitaria exilis TaxID=1010633 RepID=A0A835BXR0_9POAL|nr:hypothetical protein HU200_025223 [Digitaria exilis]CAB3501419.1 unnamed protein product [Digitaria exilis]